MREGGSAEEVNLAGSAWLQGRFLRGSDLGLALPEEERYKEGDPFVVLDADGHPVFHDKAAGPVQLFVDGAVNPLRAYLDTEPLAGITGPKFQLTRREFADYRAPIQTENATFATLLGPSFCDPNFSFPDAPPPWTTPELQQVLTAMRPLTGPLQDAIRDYFGTSPDVGAAQRAIACKILT